MTKAELIDRIARSRDLPPDITKKVVAEVLDLAFAELGQYFVRGKLTRSSSPRFTFPKFGTFTKKKRSARRGVNPRTLEPMEIEASDTIDFKPSVELKRLMNDAVVVSKTSAPAKPSAKPKTRAAATTGASKPAPAKPAGPRGPGGRKLVTREEAELELGGDQALLPDPPLQKVRRKSTGAAAKPKTRRRAG
ncbi:HU family DNA-binding protein [Nannocystaceae bacterium ST9]